MVTACHFDEGAVIIADSRATWAYSNGGQLLSDRAQKILPLDSNLGVAFAGSMSVANKIVSEIRLSIKKKPRLANPVSLSRKLSRTAAYYYRKCLQNSDEKNCLVSLMLGCMPSRGEPLIWTFQAPDFVPILVSEWAVIGTGSVVSPYLKNNIHRIDEQGASLKEKATILISGLESELSRNNVVTVGGLLQAILLTSGHIYPLTYRFMDLTPDTPASAKETTISKGIWTQKDLGKQKKVTLLKPSILLRSLPEENRFHDYEPAQAERKSPRWYLGHFMTCLKVDRKPTETIFHGLLSQVGAYCYPINIPILISLDFWGAIGTYPLTFYLDSPKSKMVIHQEDICVQFPFESIELERLLKLNVKEPGPIFLECHIDNFLLARRALFFGRLSTPQATTKEEWFASRQEVTQTLVGEHRQCSDPSFGETFCFLDAFIICQGAILSENMWKFVGEIRAVYSKKYPLSLKLEFISVFRLSEGKHNARIDMFNAFTHEVITVTSGFFEGSSECAQVPVKGAVIVKFPEPGMYYFNLYVDDQFISSILLPAETDDPKYSYSLLEQDLESVRSGEVFILAKRSQQAPKNSKH
jgi:20S proteasome alpha/beta subunit